MAQEAVVHAAVGHQLAGFEGPAGDDAVKCQTDAERIVERTQGVDGHIEKRTGKPCPNVVGET